MKYKIGAVITTYNPDIDRLKSVINNIYNQVFIIVIVDNNSNNYNKIYELFKNYNINFVKRNKNYGLGSSLNHGIDILMDYNLDYIVTLDQDSVPLIDFDYAIDNAINKYNNIGIISIAGNSRNKNGIEMANKNNIIIISGSINNINIYKNGIRYREDFFVDQIDIDFKYNVEKAGFKVLIINGNYLDHRLGIQLKGKYDDYELPWRLYLIIRNSTSLLIERKISFKLYISQLINWNLREIYFYGMYNIFFIFIINFTGLFDGIINNNKKNMKFYNFNFFNHKNFYK